MIKQIGRFNVHASERGWPFWTWLKIDGHDGMITLSEADVRDLIFGLTEAERTMREARELAQFRGEADQPPPKINPYFFGSSGAPRMFPWSVPNDPKSWNPWCKSVSSNGRGCCLAAGHTGKHKAREEKWTAEQELKPGPWKEVSGDPRWPWTSMGVNIPMKECQSISPDGCPCDRYEGHPGDHTANGRLLKRVWTTKQQSNIPEPEHCPSISPHGDLRCGLWKDHDGQHKACGPHFEIVFWDRFWDSVFESTIRDYDTSG